MTFTSVQKNYDTNKKHSQRKKPLSIKQADSVKAVLKSNPDADKQQDNYKHEVLSSKQPRIRATIKRNQPGSLKMDKSLEAGKIDQDQSIRTNSIAPHSNGLVIRATVENGTSSSEYPDGYRWAQTISTNVPLGGTTSPYVDPRPNDDTKPFYYTDAEHTRYTPNFYDRPSRRTPSSGTTRWEATLSLNGVSGTNVTAFDVMSYGFELDSSGTVSLLGSSSVTKAAHQSILRSEFPGWTFS